MKKLSWIAPAWLLMVSFADARGAEACQARALGETRLLFDNRHLLPAVDVTVNGKAMRFLLDTGTDATLLSARHKELAGGKVGSIGGYQGAARLGRATLDDFSVGPFAAKRMPVFVELDESIVSSHFDGVLGTDILMQYGLEMSFRDATLRFYALDSCLPGWTGGAAKMELLKARANLPLMRVAEGDGAFEALFDTGATASLVTAQFLARAFPGATVGATKQKAAGFGGVRAVQGETRIGPVTFGAYQVRELALAVIDPAGQRNRHALIVGNDFISGYRFYLSSQQRTIHFEPAGWQGAETPHLAWKQSLALGGNVHAQVMLAESAQSPAERAKWQGLAAENGHAGSLVALAVRARKVGDLARASALVNRALASEPGNHYALVERFFITLGARSEEEAIAELGAALPPTFPAALEWQRSVFQLLMGKQTAEDFAGQIVKLPAEAAPRCSLSAVLRELGKASKVARPGAENAIRTLCPAAKG